MYSRNRRCQQALDNGEEDNLMSPEEEELYGYDLPPRYDGSRFSSCRRQRDTHRCREDAGCVMPDAAEKAKSEKDEVRCPKDEVRCPQDDVICPQDEEGAEKPGAKDKLSSLIGSIGWEELLIISVILIIAGGEDSSELLVLLILLLLHG